MKDEKISENIRVEETGEKTETEKSNSKAILRQNKILRNLFITYMFVVGYQHLAFNFGWKYPAAYEIKNQHKGIIERKFMMNYFPKIKIKTDNRDLNITCSDKDGFSKNCN